MKASLIEKQLVLKTKSLGNIFICANAKFITRVLWEDQQLDMVKKSDSEYSLLVEAKNQIIEYLDGLREEFDLDISLEGTPFQKSVWKELLKVPFGSTSHYQQMAIDLGNPNAIRALGTANSKNPINIIVPCHRIIRKNGDLSGYAGGVWRKEILLKLESKTS